jgi:predicted nucleic acid-binding protein
VKFILDTNVISEYTKKEPVRAVLDWLERIPETDLYISVLTLGEIKQGIEKLPAGRKKGDLLLWFERLRDSFHDHILPVDESVALRWGETICPGWKDGGSIARYGYSDRSHCSYS